MTLRGPFGLMRTDIAHGRRLRRAIDEVQPNHCVIMYFDHVQLSLALDLRFDEPVTLSGIYFRPTFHYALLEDGPRALTEKITSLRKSLLLRAALRNPHVTHLFSLDPYAAEYVGRWSTRVQALAIPDGVDQSSLARRGADVRRRLGIDRDRSLAVMFGVIDSRKGIFQVLEALDLLSSALQERLCLALVGPHADAERLDLRKAIERARRTTRVQIVTDDRFILQEEIPDIVGAADVVVLTYQRHVGSSNVLVWAAAAERPVLGPRYGLVGEYIRRHRLGMDVDTKKPAVIAAALARLVDRTPDTFSVDEARRFAAHHTARRFAETILSRVLGPPCDSAIGTS
jgi:glycosyltransferase involved in cell wall biosynthesis